MPLFLPPPTTTGDRVNTPGGRRAAGSREREGGKGRTGPPPQTRAIARVVTPRVGGFPLRDRKRGKGGMPPYSHQFLGNSWRKFAPRIPGRFLTQICAKSSWNTLGANLRQGFLGNSWRKFAPRIPRGNFARILRAHFIQRGSPQGCPTLDPPATLLFVPATRFPLLCPISGGRPVMSLPEVNQGKRLRSRTARQPDARSHQRNCLETSRSSPPWQPLR